MGNKDGILNHSSGGRAATMEGRCVALADRIAYINHDIDDSIRAGILTEDDLPKDCIAVLGNSHGDRIDTMIKDTVENSIGKPEILMSPVCRKLQIALENFVQQCIRIVGEQKKKRNAIL